MSRTSGFAVCGATGTLVGAHATALSVVKVAQTQQTSLCDYEVVLICINDGGSSCFGASSSGLVLVVMWIRSVATGSTLWCSAEMRNPWLQPCSQFVPVIPVRNGCHLCRPLHVWGKGPLEPCEKDCWHVDDPAAVVRIGLAQLRHKLPSVRVASFLEGSVGLSHRACKRISADFVACALALGVSKHHFPQRPLSPHSRAAQRKNLNVCC